MFGQWTEGVEKTLAHFVFIRTEEIPTTKQSQHGFVSSTGSSSRTPSPSWLTAQPSAAPEQKKRPGLGLPDLHSIDLHHSIPAAPLSIAHSFIPPRVESSVHINRGLCTLALENPPLPATIAHCSSPSFSPGSTRQLNHHRPPPPPPPSRTRTHARGLLTCRTAPLIEEGCLPADRLSPHPVHRSTAFTVGEAIREPLGNQSNQARQKDGRRSRNHQGQGRGEWRRHFASSLASETRDSHHCFGTSTVSLLKSSSPLGPF